MSTTIEACCTLDISGTDQEKLVTMFKAIGNPIRFEIMKFLLTHPGCITGDLVDHLPCRFYTTTGMLRRFEHEAEVRLSPTVELHCLALNVYHEARNEPDESPQPKQCTLTRRWLSLSKSWTALKKPSRSRYSQTNLIENTTSWNKGSPA